VKGSVIRAIVGHKQKASLWAGDKAMKHRRTRLGTVIGSTAVISLVYLISVVLGLRDAIVWGLLGVACLATIRMAILILKHPHTTNKTFDQQFYENRDDLRRCNHRV
jgi:hypothetical protein